jgi:hypothetical protein
MAVRARSKSQFDVVAASMLLANLVEVEQAAADSGAKAGSVLPDLLRQVRAFVVFHADKFDDFDMKAFEGVS